MKSAYLWYGRFVGTANLLYGAWLVIATIINIGTGAEYDAPWTIPLILLLGTAGAISSTVFLLSIDGPERYRARPYRRISWIVMFAAVLLPSSITFFLAPLTALSVGLTFMEPDGAIDDAEESPTSG